MATKTKPRTKPRETKRAPQSQPAVPRRSTPLPDDYEYTPHERAMIEAGRKVLEGLQRLYPDQVKP